MRLTIPLIMMLLSIGCAEITVDPPESKQLVGTCKKLVQPAYLVKTGKYSKAGMTSGRLMITEEFYKNHIDGIIGHLEKGTEMEVTHIVKDENLTASCWYAEVRIKTGPFPVWSVKFRPVILITHQPG